MRILVLGGTGFLGRALTGSLLARGHEPTLFHRGLTGGRGGGEGLFPDVEHLLGDRDGGFALPPGRSWDVALDTCGYVPRVVGANARALAGRVERLCFVSSISVYADLSLAGLDEEAPRKELPDPTTETVDPETYGGLKALCEDAVREAFPDSSLIVRPGLIAGPYDDSDRFTYWVARLARGGDVLAPAPPDAAVQLIDVRDLAEWTVELLERGVLGVLHASGPAEPLDMAGMLAACRHPDVEARLEWVDGEFLVSRGVAPWGDLPLWTHVPRLAGVFRIDLSRALAQGLRSRPLAETAGDVRRFAHERQAAGAHRWSAGLSAEREAELLAAWRSWRAARPP